MLVLLLKTTVSCRSCFLVKLPEEVVLNYAAPVRKLKLDTAGFEHIEAGVNGQWPALRVLCKYAVELGEALLDLSAVEIPVLIFAVIPPVTREPRGEAHLDAVNQLAVNRSFKEVISRERFSIQANP